MLSLVIPQLQFLLESCRRRHVILEDLLKISSIAVSTLTTTGIMKDGTILEPFCFKSEKRISMWESLCSMIGTVKTLL
jgi:hypothetical protein